MQQWFTLTEAAEKSGLGNTTIRSKIQSGEIRAVKRPSKHGERWEISLEALNDFLRSLTDQTSDPSGLAEDLGDHGGVRGLTIKTQPSEPYASSELWPRIEPSEQLEPSLPSELSLGIITALRDELSALRTENTELKMHLAKSQAVIQDERVRHTETDLRAQCAVKIIQEAQSRVEILGKSKRAIWRRWF